MTTGSREASRPGWLDILAVGLCVGLAGGLGEVARLLVRRYALHEFIFRGQDFIWMVPVSLASICTLAAAGFAAFRPLRLSRRLAALPFIGLAFLALQDVMPNLSKVHPLARLLLVIAIAAQAGFWAARHQRLVLRCARRAALPLLALVALLFVGSRAGGWLRERQALANLPSVRSSAPNVLFLVLDTERASDLSLYGYGRNTTPALDRLGARGVVFDRAYSTTSWTLSSHASMFTGRLPFETGASWTTPLATRFPTLAETFRRRGYLTAGFSANTYVVSWETGLARGFIHFEDYPVDLLAVLTCSAVGQQLLGLAGRIDPANLVGPRKSTPELRRDVLAWLARRPAGRPYFAFLNAFDAHGPYFARPPFDTAFIGRRIPWSARNPFLNNPHPITRDRAVVERDAYDQALASQDHEIGLLLEAMGQRGLLDNTLVIVTADHGEEFGSWGLLGHGNSLNPAALWVPLVMAFPGRLQAGSRVPEPVSLIDLPATVLSLTRPEQGAELPGLPLVARQGEAPPRRHSSIIEQLRFSPGHPAWYPVSQGPLEAVTLDGWHYIRNAEGEETLLDIREDPAGRRVDLKTVAAQNILRMSRATLVARLPGEIAHLGPPPR